MPTSDIVTLLIIIKICGRISASRLHKIIYILKMKHDIPLSLDYQTSPSIYSSDLDYTLGVLVAFSLLDVQIISRREYIDRIYRVTEKGLRMLSKTERLRGYLISLGYVLGSWKVCLLMSL